MTLLQDKPLPPAPPSAPPTHGDLRERYGAQLAVGLSLLALLAMCVHWWHAGYVIAQGDNPPLITPGIWFIKALGAWSNYNAYFGQIDGSYTFVPFMIVWWTADHLFGGSFGQTATHYLVVAAAWGGAYRFARALGVRVAAAAIGAWLYAVNPFTQLVFGPTLTEGIFFGIIAWVAVWAATAACAPARRRSARLWLSLLAFAAMPALGPTPGLVFQMALGSVVLIAGLLLVCKDGRDFVRWAMVTALYMIAASLWWVVPDAVSFMGVTIPHPTALSDLSWTYARSSLLNNLRFLYTWLWLYPEYYPFAAAYDHNVLTYVSGFFAVFAAATGLIVLRGARLAFCRYALAVALAVMFISKGTHPPLEWINSAFARVPGAFLVYADPGGEVALALLVLSAATAMLLERAKPAVLAGSFAAIALSGVYLLTGAVFHGTVVSSNGELMPSQYVKIPAYWTAAADYLNAVPEKGGALLLPPHLSPGYDVFYNFGYYGIDSVATNLISRRLLYLDAGLTAGLGYLKHVQSQDLADRLRDLLAVRSPLAVPMMRELGIRYVVYRGDIRHMQHEWYSQTEMTALFHREPAQFGPLAIYDLGAAESTFSLQRAWIAGGYGTANAADMAELGALEEPLARVDIASVPPQFRGRPTLIEQSNAVVDGADDARPVGGSQAGVDRVVSFATDAQLRKIRVVAKAQARREMRVSFARESTPIEAGEIPLSALRTQAPRGLTLLTSHTAAFVNNGGRVAMRQMVRNLNAQAVWADVLVHVPEQAAGTYSLTVQNTRYEATAQRAGSGFVLHFHRVLIPQGETAMGLFARAAAPGRQRAISGGTVRFDGMPYSFAFTALRPTGDSQNDPISAIDAVSLGSTTLDFSGTDHATIELVAPAGENPMLTAIATFAYRGRVYRCPARIYPNQPTQMNYSIGACLRQNWLPVNVQALHLLDLELVAPADQNDLAHLRSAIDGARLVETAWQGLLTPVAAAPGTIETGARIIRLAHHGDLTSAELEAPAPNFGPSSGARVSAQIGRRKIEGVAHAARGGLAIEERDHTVEWIPSASRLPLTITGYRLPVTARWHVNQRSADPIVNVRLFGCSPDAGASVTLRAQAAGLQRIYQQPLVAQRDGNTFSAIVNADQAFGGAGAALSEIAATCITELDTGAHATFDAQLTIVQRQTAAPAVEARPLPGSDSPTTLNLSEDPAASVAAAGAAPAAIPASALDCSTRGVRCGMYGVRASVPAGFTGLAVFNRLYDRSWLAVQIGHGISLPKHVRADGWRNAWFISQGGELVVLNLMNLFTIAGLLVGLGTIAWQLRYKRS